MIIISLTSDNFESQKMTIEAYEIVALTMSSGDHGCHDAQVIVMPKSYVKELIARGEVLTSKAVQGE